MKKIINGILLVLGFFFIGLGAVGKESGRREIPMLDYPGKINKAPLIEKHYRLKGLLFIMGMVNIIPIG